MARYSIATTRDHLSSLIDKALAGEEVIITRDGEPVVALSTIRPADPPPKHTSPESWERLRQFRESQPMQSMSYLDLKRLDEAEGGH